jgi:hypothetical protein
LTNLQIGIEDRLEVLGMDEAWIRCFGSTQWCMMILEKTMHIKIISSKTMHVHKPDIIIVFAWHMFDAIYIKWKKKLKTTKFVSLLPNLTIRN